MGKPGGLGVMVSYLRGLGNHEVQQTSAVAHETREEFKKAGFLHTVHESAALLMVIAPVGTAVCGLDVCDMASFSDIGCILVGRSH